MINWWLIVLAVIIAIGIVGLSIYLLILYLAEEDQEGGWIPKGIVVLGFTLASLTVLLLPFDVAARVDPMSVTKFTTTIDTQVMWQVVLWLVAAFAVVVVPFAYFYYEAFDPDEPKLIDQILPAAGYTAIFVLVTGGLVVVLWYTVGNAIITYYSYQVPLQLVLSYDTANM